jgi:hypothetical protein
MVGKYIRDSKLVNREFDCHFVNMTLASSLNDVGRGGVRKLWVYLKKLWEIRRAIRKCMPEMIYVTPNTSGGRSIRISSSYSYANGGQRERWCCTSIIKE